MMTSDILLMFFLLGVLSAENVSVKEGDSVTLHTDVETNQQEIRWHFNDTRIAQITGDLNYSCTDVQCEDGDERFRGRLKLDNQTGSLTIMNTRTTDSGVYLQESIFSGSYHEEVFSLSVHDVPDDEREVKKISVKEGESVTLDPSVMKQPNDVMMWHFNDNLIAEITGDQSKICTDAQCDERFRDRLKLNNQTASLNIANITTQHAGLYKLQIISSRFSICHHRSISITSIKSFRVDIIAVSGSGLSSSAVAGICAAVLLLLVAAVVSKCHARWNCIREQHSNQVYGTEHLSSGLNMS